LDSRPQGSDDPEGDSQDLTGFRSLLARMSRSASLSGPLQQRLRSLFAMTSDLAEADTRETLVRFLRRTTLFGELQDRDLYRLARFVHVRHFEDGEFVYEEGRPGAALFLVRRGSVDITKRLPDGSTLSIATLTPPASFEELAAIGPDVVRWTSARASGAAELLALGRSDLESLGRQSPSIANKVIVRLAEVTARRVRALLESQGLQSSPVK